MATRSCGKVLALAAMPVAGLLFSEGAHAQAIGSGGEAVSAQAPVVSDQSTNGHGDANSQVGGAQTALPEVVVTGTLIRGVAPTGTNVIDMSRQDIEASGATTTDQVLARIPQVTSAFNSTPSIPGGTGSGITSVQPNLRNLGAGNGSTTLILLDGHRIVSTGVGVTSPDPDIIPPGVIDRVEVVPDGGSSIYGSDAVGGVINFITRKKFNGVEASARAGFADHYWTTDANLTLGQDWGSGSGYISYAVTANNTIFSRNRDFVRQTTANSGACAPGTVSVTANGTTTSYALPNLVPGTMSNCNSLANSSFYPAQTLQSVFGGLHQTINPWLKFDLTSFYSLRDTTTYVDWNNTPETGTISSSNPYYSPIGSNDPGTQTVNFSYAGVLSDRSPNKLTAFGITPSFTADLGGGWQIRALENVGQSIVVGNTDDPDATAQAAALAGTTAATALDPYDLPASNPAVLNGIKRDFYGRGQQNLFNSRVVLEGTPFNLPGGKAHLAFGGEVIHESITTDFGDIVPGAVATAPHSEGDRTVNAAFGELVVPIVGGLNQFAGVHALRLSASGRYDHYSDFGDTINPKFGLTYEPLDWVTLRANTGRSFDAPSLADEHAADSRIIVLPFSPILDPNDPPTDFFKPTIALAGGNPSLKPQKARTWSAGLEMRPTLAPGLTLGATYYHINLTDQIAMIPALTLGNAVFAPAYAPYVVKNPTEAQVEALAPGQQVQGASSLDAVYAGGTPYVLLDLRRNNLGVVKQDGIDFNVSYAVDTQVGLVTANIAGTQTLHRWIQPVNGAPFSDELKDPGTNSFDLVASLGDKYRNMLGLVTLSHSGGYKLNPAVTSGPFGTQNYVDSFNVLDLFFEYDIERGGILKDVALTLNVNNVLDAEPPKYNGGNGYANGSTLGRVAEFGVRKKF